MDTRAHSNSVIKSENHKHYVIVKNLSLLQVCTKDPGYQCILSAMLCRSHETRVLRHCRSCGLPKGRVERQKERKPIIKAVAFNSQILTNFLHCYVGVVFIVSSSGRDAAGSLPKRRGLSSYPRVSPSNDCKTKGKVGFC